MKKEQKGELNKEERILADEVADEIIEQDDKENRRFLIFLLIFVICLIFLISSLSFAMFGHHHSGSHNNIIEGNSILFSFSEDSDNIEIINAYPTSDEVGKKMTGHKQYLDFTVSVGFSKEIKNPNLSYEISLIPLSGNTLSDKYIRVYLEENGEEVFINKQKVNNFSDLSDSVKFENGKQLVTRKIENNVINSYRLRLWLSDVYGVSDVSYVFKCKVAVGVLE